MLSDQQKRLLLKQADANLSTQLTGRQRIQLLLKMGRMFLALSQGEFATLCGIDKGNLSKIESGRLRVSVSNARKIGAAFGVEPSVFLEKDESFSDYGHLAATNAETVKKTLLLTVSSNQDQATFSLAVDLPAVSLCEEDLLIVQKMPIAHALDGDLICAEVDHGLRLARLSITSDGIGPVIRILHDVENQAELRTVLEVVGVVIERRTFRPNL